VDPGLVSEVFLATPHIAGYSVEGKVNGTKRIVQELAGFFKLPLTGWNPDSIPLPAQPEIIIDGEDKTSEEIISHAVRHTYNIWEDDKRFRNSISTFEMLRGNYPVRREFSAYTISVNHVEEGTITTLQQLGFNVRSSRR